MLFNSIDFAIFLPIVFLLYWFVVSKNLEWQNLLIVVTSYIFYGWWDWKFLGLIFISTLTDYLVGLQLEKQEILIKRRLLLAISVCVNLGLLGFFKYYNFFVDNFTKAFTFFGSDISINSLEIILPVGISFYTFQTMSYTIDVYRDRLAPTKDFVAFASFVSFFPQLVAGPIERATNLLPQFHKKRFFDYQKAVDGLRQILWGLFKKIVIADNCAQIVNEVFANHAEYPGGTLLVGAFFFAFQIYADFSGYSDIAIGTAKLFGVNLSKNFASPLFSRDVAEFWRRWHISQTTWFRDYLYKPLGGSKGGRLKASRNVIIVFAVSGLWHGANWTFLIWGILNALLFLPLMLMKRNRNHTNIVAKGKSLPSLKELFQIIFTFVIVSIITVFFRAENVSHALSYLSKIFSTSVFQLQKFNISGLYTLQICLMVLLFIIIEWRGRGSKYALEQLGLYRSERARLTVYFIVTLLIFMFSGQKEEFIYFNF